MAIQYPGGTIVNTTFTGATRTNIVNNLETQLTNAGWSVISGSGTGDVIMESASTPNSNSIRVRLRDSNLTNCACINMQNAAATKVTQNYFLLPAAAKTFRVIANKYQFFCFTPGTSAAREFIGCGVPYVPSFLAASITGDFGWIVGNGQSDTDTSVRASLRTLLAASSTAGTGTSWYSAIVNGNLLDSSTTSTSHLGAVQLVVPYTSVTNSNTGGYRWHDDSLLLSDPLIAWGLTALGDEAKIRGQLWGAMVVSDSFAADTTLSSVDGHNWWGITNTNAGAATSARGTLFIITT